MVWAIQEMIRRMRRVFEEEWEVDIGEEEAETIALIFIPSSFNGPFKPENLGILTLNIQNFLSLIQ